MAKSHGCGWILVRWAVSAASVYAAAMVVPGIGVRSFGWAMVAAAVLGLLNAVIRPILILLTLPITIVTLGLFLIVINAAMLYLTTDVVPGFVIRDFWAALLGAVVIGVVHMLLDAFIKGVAGGR